MPWCKQALHSCCRIIHCFFLRDSGVGGEGEVEGYRTTPYLEPLLRQHDLSRTVPRVSSMPR